MITSTGCTCERKLIVSELSAPDSMQTMDSSIKLQTVRDYTQ